MTGEQEPKDQSDDVGRNLLDDESRGGRTAVRGFDFQRAYALTKLIEAIPDPEFAAIFIEGAVDVETRYERRGKVERHAIQVKNHRVTTAKAKEIVNSFIELDLNSPNTWISFVIACTELDEKLKGIHNALKEYRRFTSSEFYSTETAILTNTRNEVESRIQQVGLPVKFVLEFVTLEPDLNMYKKEEWVRATGLDLLQRAAPWITRSDAEKKYLELWKLVSESTGVSIKRQQVIELVPLTQKPLKLKPFEPKTVPVPAGKFLMGSDPGPGIPEYETPQFSLELPAFNIGKFPVTNEQYAEFLRRSDGFDAPPGWDGYKPPPSENDHPVAGVSWDDARKYCEWLNSVTETGGTYMLPSEAQWEKAARGEDGLVYPWGNEWPENPPCNLDDQQNTPVDEYPQGVSPYGCWDMVGNVREWTRSLWGYDPGKPDDEYCYEWEMDIHNDDDGVFDSQVRRVYRGRGEPWYEGLLRASLRSSQLPRKTNHAGDRLGFRIVLIDI